MKPTELLLHEHRVIERGIASIEVQARRLDAGQGVRPGFFLDAADFIQGFADACHHRKEEGVLFERLIAAGSPRRGGPVAVMLAEHEQGRVFTRAMRRAAEQLAQGDASAAGAVTSSALGYAALLRSHIQKEEGILFPLADTIIPSDQYDEMLAEFERIEEVETGAGVHEKYLALLESMEHEAA